MKLTKLNELIEDGEIVKGSWELTPNHELQYRSKGQDEEIKVTGNLIAVEPGALVFSVTEKQTNQKIVTSIVKLAGNWKLNSKNQIAFSVEKEAGKNDTLTFQGSWKLNDSQEIVYTYETTKLKTKTKETQELLFKGYWDITEKNRLTYSIGGDSNNTFKFRGTFQTTSIYAKKGEIRYQIGVEMVGKRKIQTVTLFGKWIISRNLNLSFEIEYDGKQRKTIIFGGTYSLSDSTDITVNLRSQTGKPLGIELILTKEIFNGDGNMFLRLQKSLEEARAEAGVKVKW